MKNFGQNFWYFYRWLKWPTLLLILFHALAVVIYAVYYHSNLNIHQGIVVIQNFAREDIHIHSITLKRPQYNHIEEVNISVPPNHKIIIPINIFEKYGKVEMVRVYNISLNEDVLDCEVNLNKEPEYKARFQVLKVGSEYGCIKKIQIES